MKTIKINGVELRVTRETTDTTVERVQRFGTDPIGQTSGAFTIRQIIDAIAPGLDISITGRPVAIQALFDAPSDPHSLIQRALSALGYVVGDHQKDVEQFSQWVDNFSKFPQTIDAEKLWTDAILARLNSPEPPTTNETIDEASAAAQRVVIQRMRLFPATAVTIDGAQMVGMDLGTDAWAELQEWRSAAKLCGLNSPKELAGSMSETFGQLVDRKVVSEWQDATGCHDPGIAKERIKQLRAGYNSADTERSQLKRDAEHREQTWVNATDRHCPGDAKQRIDDLRMQVEMQAETIRTWKKATGADSPESAINTIGASFDSWKEATGCANAFQAQKKLADLEAKLLSYASEIDALRKTSSTVVRDPVLEMRACDAEHEKRVAAERELAKVKAELDSKRRECQTEKERADKTEAREHAIWASIHRIREAAGLSFDEEILPLIEQWCSDAREKLSRAIIPLPKPDKVEAGQRWAFVMKATSGPEDGNAYLAGRFRNAWGNHYGALTDDIRTGFYLGT